MFRETPGFRIKTDKELASKNESLISTDAGL